MGGVGILAPMLLFLSIVFLGFFLARFFESRSIPGLVALLCIGLVIGQILERTTGFRFAHENDWISIHITHGQALFFKELALVVILLRAGLGIALKDVHGLKKVGLKLGCIPMALEVLAVSTLTVFLLKWSLWEGMLLGTVLAAVSPAVIVPRMLKLMDDPEVDKSVPTTILMGSSLDDILALFLFGCLISYGNTGEAVHLWFIKDGLPGVILGIGLGWLAGYFLSKLKSKIWSDKSIFGFVASFLLIGLCLSIKEQITHYDLRIHSLLLIITFGLSFLHYSQSINGLTFTLKHVWNWVQIPLFILIGMQLDPSGIPKILGIGLLILLLGLMFRSIGVVISLLGSGWLREFKNFSVMAFIPKATVQAAIGAVVLDYVLLGKTGYREEVGDFILSLAVLSILFTAPLGAWLIDRKSYLLKKK